MIQLHALVRIGEDLVCARDLFESLFSSLVSGIFIRMKLHRQFSISLFDFSFRSGTGEPQYQVGIFHLGLVLATSSSISSVLRSFALRAPRALRVSQPVPIHTLAQALPSMPPRVSTKSVHQLDEQLVTGRRTA